MTRRPTIDRTELDAMLGQAARAPCCTSCGEGVGKTTRRTRDAHGEVIEVRCVGCGAKLAPR